MGDTFLFLTVLVNAHTNAAQLDLDQWVMMSQKDAELMFALTTLMIAVLNLQVKTGDGMSHRLAKKVTLLSLTVLVNAHTNAALPVMILHLVIAAELMFALTTQRIAVRNLQVKTGDGMNHKHAKKAIMLLRHIKTAMLVIKEVTNAAKARNMSSQKTT